MSSEADRLVDLVIGKGGFPGIVSIFLMKSGVRSSTEDLRGKANVNRTSLEVGEWLTKNVLEEFTFQYFIQITNST